MENISEDDGWEFVNLGDQQSFGIKTAGLEEKATACQMLVSGQRTSCWLTWWTLTRGPDVSVSLPPGVLREGAEGGLCGIHGAGGEADGSPAEVLLPR